MITKHPKMLIRIPLDVKQFLRDEAMNNCSSQNAEVVRAIRAAMKEKGVTEAATSSRHVKAPQSKIMEDNLEHSDK